jgi:hypothetical protein
MRLTNNNTKEDGQDVRNNQSTISYFSNGWDITPECSPTMQFYFETNCTSHSFDDVSPNKLYLEG